ncbi:TIR domain-containing protein [Amycolatopsis sp. NEAU-NG30]|uniref:TIR domain-containing protein n=1 Tax=Amycolatopsis melonis TaxID=3156488 RepID=A0ABV0LC28_9PSEU
MTGLFVNYRTEDGEWAARTIAEKLAKFFGVENVFFASRSITLGEDFAEAIERELGDCEILLAVIGRNWLKEDEAGRRRIDEPADWVRAEIRQALDRGISVIPVLVDGAGRLTEADLPPDIARLARCQYLRLGYRSKEAEYTVLADELVGLISDISRYRTGRAGRLGHRAPGPLDDIAEHLAEAVSAQWTREEENRRIHDPAPLPVRWKNADEALIDHWATILGNPAGVDREPLELAGELGAIVATYRRIPSGRLFVLGDAGSGKTILAIRFTLAMLGRRSEGDPVPVIVNLASWNPAKTPFRDWLTGQLADNHPALSARGPNGSSLATDLVGSGRILPVLDGFDEIAVGLHPLAMKALNGTALPLLLTSRPEEYASAVGNVDVLTAAAGIALAPLGVADLAGYLPSTTRRTRSAGGHVTPLWKPVLDRLAEQPPSRAAANLAEALSAPLMVGLARAIYSDTPGHDPADLLDGDRFGTTLAIEEHLLRGFVPALYEKAGQRRFDAARAERWLGFLADHLNRTGSHDLAWWQICSAIPRHTRAIVIGVAVTVAILLALTLNAGLYALLRDDAPHPDWSAVLLFGVLSGFSAATGVGTRRTGSTVAAFILSCCTAVSIWSVSGNNALNSAIMQGICITLIFVSMNKLSVGDELAPSRVRITFHGQASKYLVSAIFVLVGSLLAILCLAYFNLAIGWSESTFHRVAPEASAPLAIVFGLWALVMCSFSGFAPRYRLKSAIVGSLQSLVATFCLLVIVKGPTAALSDLLPVGPPAVAFGFAVGLPVGGTELREGWGLVGYLARTRPVRFAITGLVVGVILRTLSLVFPGLIPPDFIGGEEGYGNAEKIIGGAVSGVFFGIVAALIAGVFKVMEKFEIEFDITVAVNPVFLLAADRRNALARSLLYAVTLGGGMAILDAVTATGDDPVIMVGAVLGVSFAMVVLVAGRAWGRWLVLSRLWLPLTGRLPWRLVGFLEDARRRGVLRQVGAVYQFRHARLQDQLARRYREEPAPRLERARALQN